MVRAAVRGLLHLLNFRAVKADNRNKSLLAVFIAEGLTCLGVE